LRGDAGAAQNSAASDGSTNESSPVHADLLNSAQLFDDIAHSPRANRASPRINACSHAGGAPDVKFTNVRRGANRLDLPRIQAAACQNLDFRTGDLFVSRQAFNRQGCLAIQRNAAFTIWPDTSVKRKWRPWNL
jgi:hypothetical protein